MKFAKIENVVAATYSTYSIKPKVLVFKFFGKSMYACCRIIKCRKYTFFKKPFAFD